MLATGLSNRFLRFVHPRSRATVAVLASRFCRGGSSGDGNLGWWSSSSSSQRLMSSSPVVGEDRLASAAPFSCTFDPVPGAPIDTGPTSSGFDFTAEESVTVTDTEPSPKPTSIPNCVLKAAEKAGGHLDEYPQEDLYSLSVDFGGDAYCVVKQRVASAADGVGPLVLSTFSEPAGWMGTSRCPTEELWLAAQSEASSIVYHYSPFTANDLKDIKYPYIPGPLRNPPILVRYPNVEVALHAALERLEQLNDPVNFPVISSLAAGAYVSTVVIQYYNTSCYVKIFKK